MYFTSQTLFRMKLCKSQFGPPLLCQAAAVPGVRLHADTPRGPPRLTGLNPMVYWYTNQLTPGKKVAYDDLIFSHLICSHYYLRLRSLKHIKHRLDVSVGFECSSFFSCPAVLFMHTDVHANICLHSQPCSCVRLCGSTKQ